MIFTSEQEEVIQTYGLPFFERRTLKVNQQSLAELFKTTGSYRYIDKLKILEYYDPDTGLWKKISEHVLIQRLRRFAIQCGASYDKTEVNIALSASTLWAIAKIFHYSVLVEDIPEFDGIFIHAKNCVLLYYASEKRFLPVRFSPEFNSHNRVEFNYNPNAKCPRFKRDLVFPMIQDKFALKIVQRYFGQCLIKKNLSQTFLILTGPEEVGKSVLVSVIEKILGLSNVTELHPERLDGKFEMASYKDKSLLTAKDVPHDALSDKKVAALKKMTGKDSLDGELKYANERVSMTGTFNIIITGNGDITVNFGACRNAFARRILWVPCIKPEEFTRITDFDDVLIHEEAEGILAWAVRGALLLLNNNGKIQKSKMQKIYIDTLLNESVPVDTFVKNCIEREMDYVVSTKDAVRLFFIFFRNMGWNSIPPTVKKVERDFHAAMLRYFPDCPHDTNIQEQGSQKCCRGYLHCKVVIPDPNC